MLAFMTAVVGAEHVGNISPRSLVVSGNLLGYTQHWGCRLRRLDSTVFIREDTLHFVRPGLVCQIGGGGASFWDVIVKKHTVCDSSSGAMRSSLWWCG